MKAVMSDKREDRNEKIQELVLEHGGECISEIPNDSKSEIKLKCRDGHEWFATIDNVLKGKWCKKCEVIESTEKQAKLISEVNGQPIEISIERILLDRVIKKKTRQLKMPLYANFLREECNFTEEQVNSRLESLTEGRSSHWYQ